MTTSECAEEQSEQQEMIKQRLEDILRWEKESYGIDTTANLCSGNFLDAAGVTETDWYAFGIARSITLCQKCRNKSFTDITSRRIINIIDTIIF